jgi:ParB-like chromosome segregation protein Spo0J
MLTTKRYEYLQFDKIATHPTLSNHRLLNAAKVTHLEQDILRNGLLEPLVVWERNAGEFYLVGGFHRMAAITAARSRNPGYFDRVDVRVVAGDPDEIRALNLKLNADRLDTKITDYFETVVYLNNAGWSKDRIGEFLDKSTSWIDEIVKYAPMVTQQMRERLETGDLSWNRAKEIIQQAMQAPLGEEKSTLEKGMTQGRTKKPLPFSNAIKRMSAVVKEQPKKTFSVSAQDLYSLILTLQGKACKPADVERVRTAFPDLLED